MIRQSLMCSADMSPVLWHWHEDGSLKQETVNKHVCRDFSMIKEWAREHMLTREINSRLERSATAAIVKEANHRMLYYKLSLTAPIGLPLLQSMTMLEYQTPMPPDPCTGSNPVISGNSTSSEGCSYRGAKDRAVFCLLKHNPSSLRCKGQCI